MNPLANTPLFISLADGYEPAIKRQVAFKPLFTAFCIVLAGILGAHL